MKIIIFAIQIFILSINFTQAQNIKVEFNNTITLGQDKNAQVEYLFGGPRDIVTDSLGHIYIGTINNEIRVFSSEGEFIKSFAGRGRGPSELLDISEMVIAGDELIVRDNKNFKLVIYNVSGDSSYSVPYMKNVTTFSNILPFGKNYLLELSIDNRAVFSNNIESEYKIINIVSRDLKDNKFKTFDIFDHVFDSNNPLEYRIGTTREFNLTQLKNGTIALTNELYNGSVYFINIVKNSEGWSSNISNEKTDLSGEQYYELLSKERSAEVFMKHAKSIFGVASSSGPGGFYIFQKKIQSIGLFANDQWLLNFVIKSEGRSSTTILEVFDAAGSYIGSATIDSKVNTTMGMQRKFYPMHLDNNNNLYYVDYSDDVPIIRVQELFISG